MALPFGYTLNADFSGNSLTFLALILVLTLFIVLTNKRSSGQLNKRQLTLLVALRVGAMSLLLLLVFDPQISLKRVQTLPKGVAVILDQSTSMLKSWQGDSLRLKESVSGIVQSLDRSSDIKLWDMDGSSLEAKSIGFRHTSSVFNWSPQKAESKRAQNPYQAVFIISDGQLNGGRSPLDLAWIESLPIYPIYPLEPIANTELKISDLSYIYDGSNIDIKVKTQSVKLAGKTGTLTIYNQANQIVGERSFGLQSQFSEQVLSVGAMAGSNGNFKVVLSLDNGTLRSEKWINIEIEPSRKQVLLVSERVNDLHKFLVLNLPDTTYDVQIILGTTAEVDPDFQIDDTGTQPDLIILNQPGSRVLSDALLEQIQRQVSTSSPLVLFHNGEEPTDLRLLRILGAKQMSTNGSRGEGTVRWSHSAYNHPLYLELMAQGIYPSDLLNYPPISNGTFHIQHPGAVLLVAGRESENASILTVNANPPLAIFGGSDIWRWFFYPQSKSFLTLWNYLMVYLEEIATFRPVSIEIPVDTEATGAYVNINIAVKNLDHQSVPTAEIRAWQENENGVKEILDLRREKPGFYASTLITKQAGKLLVIAEAYRFGELWGRDTSTIQLIAFDGENQSLGVDESFLSRLSKRSGGSIVKLSEDELPDLPVQYYSKETTSQLNSIRSKWMFVMLVTFLVLEWILRRRNGLL